jgi:hypothetical protein
MKAYLDSTHPYYSINHKLKQKENKNDYRIGIISLILIVAFAVYCVGIWFI